MDNWINVKDSMPPENLYVLVWRGDYADIAEVFGGMWIGHDGECNPTHWMPLPEEPCSPDCSR